MTKKMNSEIEEATVPVPSARDIEIGWIVAGRLDAVDRAAVEQARVAALEFMREHLPEFVWRMPLLRRVETADRTNLRVGDRVAELLTELQSQFHNCKLSPRFDDS